jgi:tetratricopeptide (TPR) repeat protein
MSYKHKFTGIVTTLLLSTVGLFAEPIEDVMSQGSALLQNGAYDQAVSQFRKVISRDPGNFEAQFNLAFAYLSWGRMSNAVTEFQNALKLNQRCGECWSNLAMAYENLGQSKKAIDAISYAVDVNPGNIPARMNLATMYANDKRLNEAIVQYKQVLQMDGSNLEANLNIAKCSVSKGDYEQAKLYLKATLMVNPNEADAYYELGNIAWKKDKNPKEAINHYKKAISINENSQVYYENLALLYEELKENEDAISTWKTYCIYLDDALRKEQINDRIAALESGDNPQEKIASDRLFSQSDKTGEVDRLKGEMRGQEQATGSTQMITTKAVDILGDIKDIDGDKNNSYSDFDMEKAVKKKKDQNSK